MIKKIITMSVLGLMSSAPALAQSSDFDRLDGHFERLQGRVTLTIPFGTNPSSDKNATRLQLGLRQYTEDRVSTLSQAKFIGIYDRPYRESSVGLTLEEDPSFLLNGVSYELQDEQLGMSKGVKTGLITAGVVAAAVVVGIVLICSDDSCRDTS